ncbi:MAG: acyltransferase family protein [Acidimicrobiales bacterium]
MFLRAAPGSDRPFRLGHRPGLDGVRGVAIVLVVAVHATYGLIPQHAGQWVPGGFIAIDVFFVLSGFLITSLLLEELARSGTISFRQFYRRRALRLFPALWAVMVAQLVYAVATGIPLGHDLKGLGAIALYVGNWSWNFGAIIPDALGQTWSLAVEEQFYLLWPLVLFLLLRKDRRRLAVGVMAALVAVALVSRILLWRAGVPYIEIYVQTEARLDSLMLGCLLAFATHYGWRLPRRIELLGWTGAAGLAAVTLLAHREDAWLYQGGFTLVALASVLVVCAALDQASTFGRLLSLRPVKVLGRVSYSIYLWHFMIFLAVDRVWPTRPSIERLVAGLGLTAVVSALSYNVIEKPFLRRKDAGPARRRLPSGSPGSAAGDVAETARRGPGDPRSARGGPARSGRL